MATTVDLPYFATDLPCPLPTDSEINDAADIFPKYMGRRIFEVGQHYIIKFGKQVNLLEGENMFVSENTNILVPRVYALYSDSARGVNYIIMERIPGESLLSMWPQLSPSEKDFVPLPNSYGSLGCRPILDDGFWTEDPEPVINGPFPSENAFIEGMVQKYLHDGGPSYRAEFFRHYLPRVLGGHSPTFTHGDFQRKDIMIQRESADSGHADGLETPRLKLTLIDWEESGWYSTFSEYCYTLTSLRWDYDWCLCVEKALEPCIPQALWFRTVRSEMWS
ncbi:hypothetical protein BDV33DRAFT_186708 [Aspergillus novoparasiticus]|uniref:Aminoglycoside phosphotransferase domain-containing protein n=1 Tax=Aspergillus novoparasiticus TaxID=986946 RepID=A0A5N6FAQ6_9EURO|nr:hypothetical protein BDV33DRAFT_186708 [Aspergillus novoparasiticus]